MSGGATSFHPAPTRAALLRPTTPPGAVNVWASNLLSGRLVQPGDLPRSRDTLPRWRGRASRSAGRRDHTARLTDQLADELRTVDLVERLRTWAFGDVTTRGDARDNRQDHAVRRGG